MLTNRLICHICPKNLHSYANMSHIGILGSGAGKGGGGGGPIREAGGTFGKMEAAREEEFFYQKQKEQLKLLKTRAEAETKAATDQIPKK